MDKIKIETKRLILRKFKEKDINELYLILKDEEVNRFLPWFPTKSIEETKNFYEKNIKNKKYYYAICLKEDNLPIGYIKAETDESHDFGYAIKKEFWNKGITTEAGKALIKLLKADNIPYITATHDRNNLGSGKVMQKIGMKYCYSYEEQWQPKNFLVTFRMYQLNFDGKKDRIYQKYWNIYKVHYIEKNI